MTQACFYYRLVVSSDKCKHDNEVTTTGKMLKEEMLTQL